MNDFIKKELDELASAGLTRTLREFIPDGSALRGTINGRRVVNFSSNSYLGLDSHPGLKKAAAAALEKWPIGASASRLITGSGPWVSELEEKTAAWKKREAALYFGSGYGANVGIIAALADRDTDLFLDKLDHASIVDGAVLSRAKLNRYRHNDTAELERLLKRSTAARKLVVTDTIFSMDGDSAPLEDIVGLCKKYDALLIVDEAHASGVFGKTGAGMMEEIGLAGRAFLDMGTFSKALGVSGGYVAGDRATIEYLINRARSFIFTTATPPMVCAACAAAIEVVMTGEGTHLRERLQEHIATLRAVIPAAATQIVPLILGDIPATRAKYEALLEKGLLALPVRPPTVPTGTSRLRISLSAGHTDEEITALVATLSTIN
ncbi:MAG TPA: 8-amino-7-oxononanoate synthase [bacterium]|nr:8-amino-7-oxononanoate synthase [bacterium]